jgi:hypothetical protein
VKTVIASVSRTAGRMSLALSRRGAASRMSTMMATGLAAIPDDSEEDSESHGGSVREVDLEEGSPRWDTPGLLNKTLTVEGFCPDLVMQSAHSLSEMMDADENIKLSVTQLTLHTRSKPFAAGTMRVASYARTSASTSNFVVKSFKENGKMLAHLVEDMRIQALCKAFALEFNGLLKIEPPIDFVVTMCLQSKSDVGSEGGCLSLEPHIEGEYIKYNSNQTFARQDSPDSPTHSTRSRRPFHILPSSAHGPPPCERSTGRRKPSD